MKSSDFLWSDASLKIKVQLAHSLTSPSQLASQVILELDKVSTQFSESLFFLLILFLVTFSRDYVICLHKLKQMLL